MLKRYKYDTMWKNNYNKYLFSDIDFSNISTFNDCDINLQNLFNMLLTGSIDVSQSKNVFIKIKNTAIAEIVKNKQTNIETILKTVENIGLNKNNDYGSNNILKYGIIGIIVRIGDKIARLKNLMSNNTKQSVLDEKIEDTLLDTINYATYGEMLSEGVWE